MNIKYILDQENGFDPEDPLGDLYIEGDGGDFILIKDSYIDAWLMSIGDYFFEGDYGVNKIDVLEERDVIIVTSKTGSDSVTLSYLGASLSGTKSDFKREIIKSSNKLLNDLKEASLGRYLPILNILKEKLLSWRKLTVLTNRSGSYNS